MTIYEVKVKSTSEYGFVFYKTDAKVVRGVTYLRNQARDFHPIDTSRQWIVQI